MRGSCTRRCSGLPVSSSATYGWLFSPAASACAVSVMAKRSRSNTPLQALNLFNSTFVGGQGELLEKRLQDEAGAQSAAQVQQAFRLFYARPPDAYELERSQAFIGEHGLLSFVRALYNTSEFLFVF